MRKYFLILIILSGICSVFANDAKESPNTLNVSNNNSFYNQNRYRRPPLPTYSRYGGYTGNYYNRPGYHYNNPYNFYNGRNYLRNGTITGFTPPILNNDPFVSRTYVTNNGHYQTNPYYTFDDNLSLADKIKRFFNPAYQPVQNQTPYYSAMPKQNNYTPIYSDDPTGTNTGVSVQIID